MIHLDTSFLIRALVADSPQDRKLRQWLKDTRKMAMTTLAWTEFLCGPIERDHISLARVIVTTLLPFEPSHAQLAARLFNETGRRRGSLADCMIAAVAIDSESSIATANASDSTRFEGHGLSLIR